MTTSVQIVQGSGQPLITTPPPLVKGVADGNGFTVQPLRDVGRNSIALTAEFTFAQTAETMLSMSMSQNGGAVSAFTSRAIPNGKKFRQQLAIMQVELLGSGTAPQRAYLRCRVNPAGAAAVGSNQQWILPCGVTTAIVKATNWASLDIPESFELTGDGTLQYGFSLETPDWVTSTATGRAKITILGYEY